MFYVHVRSKGVQIKQGLDYIIQHSLLQTQATSLKQQGILHAQEKIVSVRECKIGFVSRSLTLNESSELKINYLRYMIS